MTESFALNSNVMVTGGFHASDVLGQTGRIVDITYRSPAFPSPVDTYSVKIHGEKYARRINAKDVCEPLHEKNYRID